MARLGTSNRADNIRIARLYNPKTTYRFDATRALLIQRLEVIYRTPPTASSKRYWVLLYYREGLLKYIQ